MDDDRTTTAPTPPSASRADATSASILAAAKAVVMRKGFAGMSTRDVASEAGMPLSQIHYHFGSKSGLVLALYEREDAALQARQRTLYAQPDLPLSAQWRIACDYLDQDIESGYVRVLLEMSAAGWTDPDIAAKVRRGFLGWMQILRDLAGRAEQQFGTFGPLSSEAVATLVANAFIGAEVFVLLGLEQDGVGVRDALRSVGHAIEQLERRNGGSIDPIGKRRSDHAGETTAPDRKGRSRRRRDRV